MLEIGKNLKLSTSKHPTNQTNAQTPSSEDKSFRSLETKKKDT